MKFSLLPMLAILYNQHYPTTWTFITAMFLVIVFLKVVLDINQKLIDVLPYSLTYFQPYICASYEIYLMIISLLYW